MFFFFFLHFGFYFTDDSLVTARKHLLHYNLSTKEKKVYVLGHLGHLLDNTDISFICHYWPKISCVYIHNISVGISHWYFYEAHKEQ